MWRLTYSSIRAHARRLISTSIAVCLGVALLSGTMVLGDTLSANFDRLFVEAFGRADVVIRSSTTLTTDGESAQGLIDGSIASELRALPGVIDVAPQIEGFGQLTGADGEKLGGDGPPTLAGNWIDDPDLNPYELAEGRAPRTTEEVVINRGAAEDGGLAVGDTAIVATPDPVEVTIVGIATFGGEDGLGPSTFTAFSLAGAEQHVTGVPGAVTGLLVQGAAGVEPDGLAASTAVLLPNGVEAITGAALADETSAELDADFLGFLRTFLLVFAGVALLVATFSIYNTFSIIVAQRLRSSALLRAVGADRRQVLGTMLAETLVVGVVASAIGLFAGFGLAQGLKAVFDAFGFALPTGGLTIRPATWVVAPLVGVMVTLLAGTGPAIRSSRVPPLAALRDIAVDRSATSKARIVIGTASVAAGVGAVLVAVARDGALGLAGLGALLTSVGVVALGPVLARPGARLLGAPLPRLRGLPGALAHRNAARSPRRTAATASALTIGIGVVTMFTAFAGSLKTSFDTSVSASIEGDLLIAASQFGGGGLSPSLATTLDALPEVDRAVGVAVGPISVAGGTFQVSVLDPAASSGLIRPGAIDGDIADVADGQLAVRRSVAEDRDWSVGTVIDVRFSDGLSETLTVDAVYDDDVLLRDAVVPRATWARHNVQTVDNLVVIALARGVGTEAGQAAVETAAAPFAPPDVQTRQEFIDAASAQIDQFLGLIYVMLGLAIVIALMGIANTMSLSIHERVRELGLLRAVGADRSQVRSMIRWESVVIALFGTISGLALGLFLGWALVTAGAGTADLSFSVPVGQLVPVIVVGALAGVLAAIRPARRAARLDVIDALATAG
ncbi:MAG: ABC transporter permease [Acidimicrobiia bacterium]